MFCLRIFFLRQSPPPSPSSPHLQLSSTLVCWNLYLFLLFSLFLHQILFKNDYICNNVYLLESFHQSETATRGQRPGAFTTTSTPQSTDLCCHLSAMWMTGSHLTFPSNGKCFTFHFQTKVSYLKLPTRNMILFFFFFFFFFFPRLI